METIRSMLRVRVLPVTIASLCLLLAAKVADIYHTGNQFSRALLGSEAYAVEEAAPTPEAASTDASSAEEANPDGETEVAALQNADAAKEDSAMVKEDDKREFSEIELDILQSLSKRREELDQLEEEVRMKESLLESTELRIDQKIEQVQSLEKTVRELLQAYDKEEEAKIASLVKIYESMKPKEAARIFDEMEMPILLMVVDRMSERRAAPILAKMSPLKAKQVTEELAEDRKLRSRQEAELNTLSGQ